MVKRYATTQCKLVLTIFLFALVQQSLAVCEFGKGSNACQESEVVNSDCTTYSDGRDIAKLPAAFKPALLEDNTFVAAPKSINVFLKVDDSKNMHLEIQWTLPPAEGKLELLRGFMLRWDNKKENEPDAASECRLFKLNVSNVEQFNSETFSYSIALTNLHNYKIQLYSLPAAPSRTDDLSRLIIAHVKSDDATVSANWSPTVVQLPATVEKSSSLVVILPPDGLAFEAYELYQSGSNDPFDTIAVMPRSADKHSVPAVPTFTVEGEYNLGVKPKEKNPAGPDCLCKAASGECASCSATLLPGFIYQKAITLGKTTHTTGFDFTGDLTEPTTPEPTTLPTLPPVEEFSTSHSSETGMPTGMGSMGTTDELYSTTVIELSQMFPSTQARSNKTLIGGLIGGLTAAAVFTLIVIIFALADRNKKPSKRSNKP
ncbi:uncharacterized protein LOC131927212 [Physella acuta]|uniref:uncharacterized protein LOC131927212 n=1 Tax=Physella acuta TaxID=109671 RepID=UPI0027DC5D7B|nr:uncharacterized protein LOC131927212 [Physella acuta]XP_059138932.1 uncharacterized protein LOC131927212 [Physella acuta]XP_059138933.1 uncharacterized protein LOC131927212 [Physella acuta]XP_059138934.1 uncharacterized protein LOC131927212 [Physella acuta]